MSGISTKLLQAAAGGGGGESNWILTRNDASTGSDAFYAAVQLSNGNLFCSATDGSKDYFCEVALDGSVINTYAKTVTSNELLIFNHLAYYDDDTIYFGGQYRDSGQVRNRAIFGKINSSGTVAWAKSNNYISSYNHPVSGMDVDSSGNLYVAYSGYQSSTTGICFVEKWSSSGTQTFKKKIQDTKQLYAGALKVDGSDNVILGATSYNHPTISPKIALLKWNSSGTLQFEQQYGVSNRRHQGVADLAFDSSDNIYLTSRHDQASTYHSFIGKLSDTGAAVWSRFVSSSTTSQAGNLSIDSSDNVFWSPRVGHVGAGGNDILLTKLAASDATVDWQNSFGQSNYDYSNSLFCDSADEIIMSSTSEITSGDYSAVLSRLPPDGTGTGTYGSISYTSRTDGLSNAGAVVISKTFTHSDGEIGKANVTISDDTDPTLSDNLYTI